MSDTGEALNKCKFSLPLLLLMDTEIKLAEHGDTNQDYTVCVEEEVAKWMP